MNNQKEKIDQLANQFEELAEQLIAAPQPENLRSKQLQLKAIEQSVRKLTKRNIEVPESLRTLKMQLVHELEQFDGAQEQIDSLLEALSPALIKLGYRIRKQQGGRRKQRTEKTHESRIYFPELFEAGMVNEGEVIYHKGRSGKIEGKINAKGLLELNTNGNKKSYESPTTAAVDSEGKSRNGWTYWMVNQGGKQVSLDELRKKLLKQNRK